MTISSSLNAGVAGLSANATRLATIADNIANSSTYGYKRSEADFSSMVMGSSSSSYTAGGVRASSLRIVDERGTLVSTTNATDLAVRGRGMFPVANAFEVEQSGGDFETMMMTTTGSFWLNSDGYLETESGLMLLGWPADENGDIPDYPRESDAGLEPVKIDMNALSGEATTSVHLGVNLPATETESDATGETRQMVVEYYDNLGISQTLNITFTPTIPASGSSNEWTMSITDSASGSVVGEYTMTFNDSRTAGGTLASVTATTGGAYDSSTGTAIVNVAGGPIEVYVGELGTSGGITQLSDSYVPTLISKDGTPVGNVTSLEVDVNGFVHAHYDNGASQTVYQIPLVDVSNLNGLEAHDAQTYTTTLESGDFFLWDAGAGPTGEVVSFAREESTTDVAGELTDMIRTQRAYSSNAKVFQTVDEMLQETTNIKR